MTHSRPGTRMNICPGNISGLAKSGQIVPFPGMKTHSRPVPGRDGIPFQPYWDGAYYEILTIEMALWQKNDQKQAKNDQNFKKKLTVKNYQKQPKMMNK